MIEFPARWVLYGFDILYGGLLLLAAAYLVNALRHGARMALTIFSSIVFLAGVVGIVWLTWSMLSPVDWVGSFTINVPSFDFIRFGL